MIPGFNRALFPKRDVSAKPVNRISGTRRRPRALGVMAILAGFALISGTAYAQVQPWNLPYVRPAAYDYSNLYAPNLKTYIAGNPTFFKTRLQGAWTYWKANFISSNGLVNHRRLDPNGGSIIGTTEAVSEGQGYGMLISVLLNDQATFNKIFEAANSNLWDSGKKSRMCCSYKLRLKRA